MTDYEKAVVQELEKLNRQVAQELARQATSRWLNPPRPPRVLATDLKRKGRK